MGNPNVTDFPPHIQKQMREKFAAEDAQRNGVGAFIEIAKGNRETLQAVMDDARKAVEKKRSKYGNTRTPYKSVQGFERVYDSKAEKEYAEFLDYGIKQGIVLWWLPQPIFPLPGERRSYRADFLVQFAERLAFIDVKGMDTPKSIDRRKEVKAHFNIDVELVRK